MCSVFIICLPLHFKGKNTIKDESVGKLSIHLQILNQLTNPRLVSGPMTSWIKGFSLIFQIPCEVECRMKEDGLHLLERSEKHYQSQAFLMSPAQAKMGSIFKIQIRLFHRGEKLHPRMLLPKHNFLVWSYANPITPTFHYAIQNPIEIILIR